MTYDISKATSEPCWWCWAILIPLVSSPLIGVGMWLYTDNAHWLWLCVTIIFFL